MHPQYEAACLEAAPDDVRPWQIYADFLMAQGDVRGEMAALLLAGKSEEANALLSRRREDVLGPLAPVSTDELELLEYRHGFLVAARLKRGSYESKTDLAELTEQFLELPFARFVTHLRFGLASYQSDNDWTATAHAIIGSPLARQIRRLDFNDYTYEDSEISWTAFGDFSKLWSAVPALESIHIRSGAGGTLGSIEHARLKTFIRESGGLSRGELMAIGSARWPALEHLEVWTGSSSYEAEATPELLAPIVRAEGLSRLRHLGIVNCELSRELLALLNASGVLPRLEVLDLSKGVLTDDEISELLRFAPQLKHLRRLDLSENLFSEEGVERIAEALPNAVVSEQREDDSDGEHRYVAVGE